MLELYFTPTETTFSYFAATRPYLARHGRPVAFYSDKHGIFRLTKPGTTSPTGLTQFGRAMTELKLKSSTTTSSTNWSSPDAHAPFAVPRCWYSKRPRVG